MPALGACRFQFNVLVMLVNKTMALQKNCTSDNLHLISYMSLKLILYNVTKT
jgi:hypothetical protein